MAIRRVLVTGATGFVGRQVLAPLLARGCEVHVTTRHAQAVWPAGVVRHVTDLLDCSGHPALLDRVRPDHLLHLAWYAEHGKFWNAVDNAHWLQATLSLTDRFCRSGGERFVGVGTCAEYDWRYGVCVEGVTPELPQSFYGRAKLAAGQAAAAMAAHAGVGFAWGRLFFPYGPGESPQRFIPHVVTRLLAGDAAACTHGRQFRDYLHVDDAAAAIVHLLDAPLGGPVNIGSGVPVSIGDVARRIGRMLGRENLVQLGALPDAANAAPMLVADPTRLREVGWAPRKSLDEGLSDTIDWWRTRL